MWDKDNHRCIPFLLIEIWCLSESELFLWLVLISIIWQKWYGVTSESVSVSALAPSVGLEPSLESNCCAVRILSSTQRPWEREPKHPSWLPQLNSQRRVSAHGQSWGWSPARASPVTFPSTATLASQSLRTPQMSSVNPDNSWTINSYCLESLSFGISVFSQKQINKIDIFISLG